MQRDRYSLVWFSLPLILHCQRGVSVRLIIPSEEELKILCSVSTSVNWYCLPSSTCCMGLHHGKICPVVLWEGWAVVAGCGGLGSWANVWALIFFSLPLHYNCYNYLTASCGELTSPSGQLETGQGERATGCARGGSGWILGKMYSLRQWLSFGTGTLGKWWSHYRRSVQKMSRWSVWWYSLVGTFSQIWTWWSQRSVPASMILWFYVIGQNFVFCRGSSRSLLKIFMSFISSDSWSFHSVSTSK